MPDARHFHDQNYCIRSECRHASKRASHRRWYESDKGAEYRERARALIARPFRLAARQGVA